MVEKIELCAIVCNCLKIIKQTCWTASSDEAVTTGKGYKMSHKYVYLFSEGNGHMRELLGGKGANLAEMTNLGMPVPQGFTITTEACTQYYKDDRQINSEIEAEIMQYVEKLEEMTGKKFGDLYNPLLVSVRSGARASMPGMMDTILNLGLNDEVVVAFAKKTNNPRFAYDSYRRFIQMYSDVVMEVGKKYFEQLIDEMKEARGVTLDTELTADDLKELAEKFKAEYKEKLGEEFPQDPKVQLMGAIKAVFRSWDNPRAIYYRRMNDIPSDWGTAVNVQSMVFGNMGNTSGTGVAFTRDPSTGEKKLYGEYLINAQGEDVVAGIRTPQKIETLQQVMPEVYEQFVNIAQTLENHYRDMQDMEYTIERGKLYMLQTRNGKRTAAAALKIAVDLVNEGMITTDEAILKVEPKQLDSLLHPQFDAVALKKAKEIAMGLAASPGAACGMVYFTAEEATAAAKTGKKVVLVRLETSPEDIEGMAHAQGILTARGGMTSHAAVVARGMGTCCVAGCGALRVDEEAKTATIGDVVFHEGDWMSIDGSTGKVYAEAIPTVDASVSGDFATLMGWADAARKLGVRTNADNPHDAAVAVKYGAEGIGLCRTEHMFFEGDRIKAVREMILASDEEGRRMALAKLLPMQRGDFEGIFEAMDGFGVTIRLLDPPLHEFVPHQTVTQKELADEMGITLEEVKAKVDSLEEFNPMLGHRGCRLGITYPEITEMQTRAIIEAALAVRARGIDVHPEIMIPLVGSLKEIQNQADVINATAAKVFEEQGQSLPYLVGTMIEVPRAALTANEIATVADFFSFGTNDLTQMTFGFSRDDAPKFLKFYKEHGIIKTDPFEVLDQVGVGQLVEMGVRKGRSVKPELKIGICGEHGGEPSSVKFCAHLGMNYVSCSPYRVPIARVAAAQAAVEDTL